MLCVYLCKRSQIIFCCLSTPNTTFCVEKKKFNFNTKGQWKIMKILFFQFQYDVTIANSKSANIFQRQLRSRCLFYKTSMKTEAKKFPRRITSLWYQWRFKFHIIISTLINHRKKEKPKEKNPEVNDKEQLNNSNILKFYAHFYFKQMLCFFLKWQLLRYFFFDFKNLVVNDCFSTKMYCKKLRIFNYD